MVGRKTEMKRKNIRKVQKWNCFSFNGDGETTMFTVIVLYSLSHVNLERKPSNECGSKQILIIYLYEERDERMNEDSNFMIVRDDRFMCMKNRFGFWTNFIFECKYSESRDMNGPKKTLYTAHWLVQVHRLLVHTIDMKIDMREYVCMSGVRWIFYCLSFGHFNSIVWIQWRTVDIINKNIFFFNLNFLFLPLRMQFVGVYLSCL